jgi:hypothetical protein
MGMTIYKCTQYIGKTGTIVDEHWKVTDGTNEYDAVRYMFRMSTPPKIMWSVCENDITHGQQFDELEESRREILQ